MSVSGCNSLFQSFQVKQSKVFQGETPVKRYKYLAVKLIRAFLHCFTVSFFLKHL